MPEKAPPRRNPDLQLRLLALEELPATEIKYHPPSVWKTRTWKKKRKKEQAILH